MLIGGFQKQSLIDYKGYVSSIIFTYGCNLRCGYCHNMDTLVVSKNPQFISENYVLNYLCDNRNLIDAVTITGGEPTLQKDLITFIQKIRNMNFKIKLDTNGTNPEVINNLMINNLIDYIAMDIKSAINFNKYNLITGNVLTKDLYNNIIKSIELIKSSKIDYEFRTTTTSNHTSDDINSIVKYLKDSRAYYIQELDESASYNKSLRMFDISSINKDDIKENFNEFGIRYYDN